MAYSFAGAIFQFRIRKYAESGKPKYMVTDEQIAGVKDRLIRQEAQMTDHQVISDLEPMLSNILYF